jgi:hypothetical protein
MRSQYVDVHITRGMLFYHRPFLKELWPSELDFSMQNNLFSATLSKHFHEEGGYIIYDKCNKMEKMFSRTPFRGKFLKNAYRLTKSERVPPKVSKLAPFLLSHQRLQ